MRVMIDHGRGRGREYKESKRGRRRGTNDRKKGGIVRRKGTMGRLG